jgi:hypothetical protein
MSHIYSQPRPTYDQWPQPLLPSQTVPPGFDISQPFTSGQLAVQQQRTPPYCQETFVCGAQPQCQQSTSTLSSPVAPTTPMIPPGHPARPFEPAFAVSRQQPPQLELISPPSMLPKAAPMQQHYSVDHPPPAFEQLARSPTFPSTHRSLRIIPPGQAFFCCGTVNSANYSTMFRSSSIFNGAALREFMKWTQDSLRVSHPSQTSTAPGRRPPAWAPYLITLTDTNKPGILEYYMPVPKPSLNSTRSHNVSCVSKYDHIRISEESFEDEFLGSVPTSIWSMRCGNKECSASFLRGKAFKIRVIPAQYSYGDDSIDDSLKRRKVWRMRETVGHATYTQDLMLALDAFGGDVEAAVETVMATN